jgi:hypothetical protein
MNRSIQRAVVHAEIECYSIHPKGSHYDREVDDIMMCTNDGNDVPGPSLFSCPTNHWDVVATHGILGHDS